MKNVTFADVLASDGTIENFNVTYLIKEVEDRRKYKYETEGGIIVRATFLMTVFFLVSDTFLFQETYNALCLDMKYLHQASQNQIYKFNYFENLQEIAFTEKLRNFFSFEAFERQYLLINEDRCLSHIFAFNSTMFYPIEFGIVTGAIDQVVPVFRDDTVYLIINGKSDECYISGTNIWELKDNNLEVRSLSN